MHVLNVLKALNPSNGAAAVVAPQDSRRETDVLGCVAEPAAGPVGSCL